MLLAPTKNRSTQVSTQVKTQSKLVQLDGGFSEVSESESETSSSTGDISLNTTTSEDNTTSDDSSASEHEDEDLIEVERNIPVISYQQGPTEALTPPAWYEPYVPIQHSKKRNVMTIRRDNKFDRVESLPVISIPNTRSLFPKINSC